MPFYAGTRARENARNAPATSPPVELVTTQRFGTAWVWPDADSEPPLPIDDSDGGCDCDAGDTPVDACVWTRQHPAIEICDGDAVSESGGEVYNLLRSRGVKTVLICGVHLNMCVLGRGFAIRQLLRLGVRVRLLRDLTDTMYNPARPPHVDHFSGTELVVMHVERHCCPSVLSTDLTGEGEPFSFRASTAFVL